MRNDAPARRLRTMLALSFAICLAFALAAPAGAQAPRGPVDGAENFGRVTPTFLRGGDVTAEGLERLKAEGVTVVIDLRDDPDAEEAETCRRLGLTYYAFPLTGHEAPEPATMQKVFELIRDAKAPMYVHCSGGKHRAGTACAQYRMKAESWSPERAWAEQQAYGFGPPEEHPELFLYLYAGTSIEKRLYGNRVARTTRRYVLPRPVTGPEPPASGVLSSSPRYVSERDVVRRARAAGATGSLIRLDLEYDAKSASVLWKVLVAGGTEYRFAAVDGAARGTKQKDADSVAVMAPIDLRGKFVPFQRLIRSVERATGRHVTEMELKRSKGRRMLFYEVAMTDGQTLFIDARTGRQILEF